MLTVILSAGQAGAPDTIETARNFGINLAGAVLLGFLLRRDLASQSKDRRTVEREEAFARLQVQHTWCGKRPAYIILGGSSELWVVAVSSLTFKCCLTCSSALTHIRRVTLNISLTDMSPIEGTMPRIPIFSDIQLTVRYRELESARNVCCLQEHQVCCAQQTARTLEKFVLPAGMALCLDRTFLSLSEALEPQNIFSMGLRRSC